MTTEKDNKPKDHICDQKCPEPKVTLHIYKRRWDTKEQKWVDTFESSMYRAIVPCCSHCNGSRAHHVNDQNKHLWNPRVGFWSPKGCRLERQDMPNECKEYTCKKEVLVVAKIKVEDKVYDVGYFKNVTKSGGLFSL